jgi:hypothetical protein
MMMLQSQRQRHCHDRGVPHSYRKCRRCQLIVSRHDAVCIFFALTPCPIHQDGRTGAEV